MAALTGKPLNVPSTELDWNGPPLVGRVGIEIERVDLNPRFVLGLIEGVKLGDSPYRVQRRLRLSGLRPINNIVDATNYVMLAIGQPLHAFDYDVLQETGTGWGSRPDHAVRQRVARNSRRLTVSSARWTTSRSW